MSLSPDETIVSAARAAELHDVSQSTIRAWVARGLLNPVGHVNGAAYFRLSDVDEAEWKARQRDVSGRSKRRLGWDN
jgi:DNA-binding transcriptional MerR regulator